MSNGRRPAQPTDWKTPAELLRMSPRPVHLTVAGRAVAATMVVLVAGACLGGAWLYAWATRDAARAMLLRSEGVSIEGNVVGLGRTRGDHPRPVVSYQYVAGGAPRSGRATLRPHDRRTFALGETITIQYLPSEPDSSWLAGHEPRGVPWWVVPIVPVCLVLGALPIAHAFRKQRTLLSEGHVALAQVTSTRRVHHGQGHGAYRVGYEFRILSGATRSGSFELGKNPPPIGSKLTVLYDPDEPTRNARYPLPFVRVGTL
jgi:hypothetical protein